MATKQTNTLVGAVLTGKPTSKKLVKKAVKTVVKKPVVKKMKSYEVLDNGDLFTARIQINDNEIKRLMIREDSNLVGEYHLLSPHEKELETKLVRSRFGIFDLINDGRSNRWLTRGYRGVEWDSFIATLLDYEQKFKEVFNSSDKDTKLPFHALPYVFTEGEELSFMDKDVEVAFILKTASIEKSFFGSYLHINGNIIHYNGSDFVSGDYDCFVGSFSTEKTLEEIGIRKLEFFQENKQRLIERGKKYFKLHEGDSSYVNYSGPIVRRGWYKDVLYPSTGRIMIDRAGMISIDPNYHKYFGGNDDDNRGRNAFKEKLEEVSDQQYLLASPYCYGFSLVSKQWGEFKVDSISNIEFRNDAYENLVLDQETKDTMFSLVEYSGEGKDLIDNKGGGCIFLLHGKPGLGKTLTAEAIAETLHRPLYMVSVGELGTDVETLDKNLRNILQIASSWNAVLLIDEVDIFLEKRDLNIERNALVGVFLRLLEYYNGILFMTTNRVNHIDEAFYSRISLAIKYPELSVEAKAHIWTLHLSLYDVKLSVKNVNKLADANLNGRQIKNCIRLTTALAYKNGNKVPNVNDFLTIIKQIESFNSVLEK